MKNSTLKTIKLQKHNTKNTTHMENTQAIKNALIKQIIESGSNIPLGTLNGNIDLLIKSAEVDGMKEARDIMFPNVTDHPNTI